MRTLSRKRTTRRDNSFVCALMINVHITTMMRIDDIGTIRVEYVLNLFHHIEQHHFIHAVVWEIAQLCALCSKRICNTLCIHVQCIKFVTTFCNIAPIGTARQSLSKEQDTHGIAFCCMTQDCPTNTEYFIIRMRRYDKNFLCHLHPPSHHPFPRLPCAS